MEMLLAKNISPRVLLQLLLVLVGVQYAQGHARLLRPPSRASMWRLGIPMDKNDYNDNEGYCGGRTILIEKFNGKCGVCGDPWEPRPRAHERGGIYYEGTITDTYTEGSIIKAAIQITAGHKGYFEFRICPYDNPEAGDIEYSESGDFVEVSQACLDKHLLTLGNTSETKYYIPHVSQIMLNNISVKLPKGLSCKKCLFQWTYTTGNSWGVFPNGTACIGCGLQETFKACADIVITASSAWVSTPAHSTSRPATTQQSTMLLSNSPSTEETSWRATDVSMTSLSSWTRILKTTLGMTSNLKADDPTTAETESWYSSRFISTLKATTPPPPSPTTRRTTTTTRRTTTTTPTMTTTPTTTTTPTPTTTATPTTTTVKTLKCEAVGIWKLVLGIPRWCINNCRRGFCPGFLCSAGCKFA